jgi:hypothetical protein
MRGPKHSGKHLKAGQVSRKHGPQVPRHKLTYSEKSAKAHLKRLRRK